ncbi:MAG: ribonuclease Z [Flavobacteriaceae bacterium]|nr:ribonuclease Z [Flavobacteriaceae bacterium]
MLVDRSENFTLITQERISIPGLVKKLVEMYEEVSTDNIIINLMSLKKIDLFELIDFLKLSNDHRKAKHSFVIVTDKVDFDEVPDELVVVPTLQEAYDIIEMEEIERDLGF